MVNVQDIGLKVQFLGIQLYQYFVIYVHIVTTARGYKKVTTTQGPFTRQERPQNLIIYKVL